VLGSQEPWDSVRVFPSCAVPEIVGAPLLAGVTTPLVAKEPCWTLPAGAGFVAVTTTDIV
jgi:hypothetical protein